jgi:hypothetical protein
VIVAGDMDGSRSGDYRCWTGEQSLDGRIVCYREAWAARQAAKPGMWASDHFGVMTDVSAFTPTGRPVP